MAWQIVGKDVTGLTLPNREKSFAVLIRQDGPKQCKVQKNRRREAKLTRASRRPKKGISVMDCHGIKKKINRLKSCKIVQTFFPSFAKAFARVAVAQSALGSPTFLEISRRGSLPTWIKPNGKSMETELWQL